jgi:hypothetical protein
MTAAEPWAYSEAEAVDALTVACGDTFEPVRPWAEARLQRMVEALQPVAGVIFIIRRIGTIHARDRRGRVETAAGRAGAPVNHWAVRLAADPSRAPDDPGRQATLAAGGVPLVADPADQWWTFEEVREGVRRGLLVAGGRGRYSLSVSAWKADR